MVGVEDIRASFGSFENVKKNKIGDRIGLCFSVTIPVMELRTDQIEALSEIIGNGHKFSNGCGLMGINIAKQVQHAFGLKEIPGAVQIRLAGMKGMLALKENFPANKIGTTATLR